MALTRKYLKALGIEEDKIDEIIGAHSETVEALKAQIAQGEEAAKQLPQLQEQLDAAKAAAAGNPDAETIRKEYETYKASVEAEKTLAAKRVAVERALQSSGANEKALKLLMNAVQLDSVALDEKGAVADADAVLDPLRAQYGDFFGVPGTQGTPPAAPPLGGVQTPPEQMTDEAYYAQRMKGDQ